MDVYRYDRSDFLHASMRWNLARSYVLIFLIPTIAIVWAFGAVVSAEVSRPVEAVSATATESSRPLGGEDKAPADWTGDGVADGWLLGEWLPGESGRVYLVDGAQTRESIPLAILVVLGFLLLLFTALIFGMAGMMAHDSLRDSALRQAEKDWKDAWRLSGGWNTQKGIPVWGR